MIATIPSWAQVILWIVGLIVAGILGTIGYAWWMLGHGNRPNTSVKKHEQRDEDP